MDSYLFEVGLDEPLGLGVWRILVKMRAGWKCEECGEQSLRPMKDLDAHHLSYEANTLRNGRALCRRCHAREHMSGREWTERERENQRISQTGKPHKKGWHLSEEAKEKIGAAQRGKIVSEESRQKMRKPKSTSHRESLRKSATGRRISKDARKKIGQATRSYWEKMSPEERSERARRAWVTRKEKTCQT